MNRPIRRVAVVAALMFFALLVNASYLAVFRADDLNADPRNRRTRDAEFASHRGAILVGNTPIAQTQPNEGRFAFKRSYANGELWAAATGYYSYDFGRAGHIPARQIESLEDYRRRYGQYKSDPNLRAMHAAHPVFAVPDDHEGHDHDHAGHHHKH